jgi:competence protein ComEC
MFDYLGDFWENHPALLIGILSVLGTASALAWHPIYIAVLLSLFLPYFWKRRLNSICLYALAAGCLAYASTYWRIPSIHLPQEAIVGEGVFRIEHFSVTSSPFNRSLCYKGVLKSFRNKEGVLYQNLPCSIFHPLKSPPNADRDYLIEGKLSQKKEHVFCLKPKKGKPWKSIEGTFSFAQWRYDAKKRIASYIKNHIADSSSANFLSALVTGDVDERSVRLDFNRLGLQHLLAISGFHFSFFALFVSILLRPFLSFRMRTSCLMALLGAYFFFLGNAPSILRAFTAICIFLSAQLLKRRTSGLNALGAALILEVFFDPRVIMGLSFQLSFLCTVALLLVYPLMHHLFCFLLPKRTSTELNEMPLFDQHGYVCSALIRKSLSLNLAVCVFSLPVLLHLFHKFPLMSLLYNLFFPFCVALSLGLLCCAVLLCAIPPFSVLLHDLNSLWTAALLQLTSHPPAYFEVFIRTKAVTFSAAICSVLLLFHIGIYFWSCQRRNGSCYPPVTVMKTTGTGGCPQLLS